jgi:hypothetical protein
MIGGRSFGFHRKDGKVVKEGDDLLCATRYTLMMLRHVKSKSFNDRWRRPGRVSVSGFGAPIAYPKAKYL